MSARPRWLAIPVSDGSEVRIKLGAERVLVCGDRKWADAELIYQWLERIRPKLVIHGAARGADTLAGVAAKRLRVPVRVFPARWSEHGRAAGPIRNRQMLKEGRPTLVLGFHELIEYSRGTRDMLTISAKAGLRALLIGVDVAKWEVRS